MRVGSSNIKNFITIIYVPFENLLTKKWPVIYIRLVLVTENYQRQKLLSPLTWKNVSCKYHLFSCIVVWSAGSYFFSSDNFQGTFVDSRFMIFTKVLMNELACTLIHVRKIFNCRMCLKMLLLMLFRNCWEETLT